MTPTASVDTELRKSPLFTRILDAGIVEEACREFGAPRVKRDRATLPLRTT
jgi:hypothetical protein